MQDYRQNPRNEWLDEEPRLITVREVRYDPLEARTLIDLTTQPVPRRRRWRWGWVVGLLSVMACCISALAASGGLVYSLLPTRTVYVIVNNPAADAVAAGDVSPIFTPEIQYWHQDILRWAETYQLDPNLIATVMQIESCGDPNAGSSAGAQGLFQVMPFHFQAGEAMQEPETNAYRGLTYLSESLKKAEGHVGLALAGYNGGHGVIDWGWARWPDETRRYFYWGVGIYYDAASGKSTSSRLNEWLAAGGSSLCAQASTVQKSLAAQSSSTTG